VKVPSLGSFVTTPRCGKFEFASIIYKQAVGMSGSEYDQPRDSPTPGKYSHIIDYFLPNLEANNGGEKEGGTLHNS
jgi:hypothetical protein